MICDAYQTWSNMELTPWDVNSNTTSTHVGYSTIFDKRAAGGVKTLWDGGDGTTLMRKDISSSQSHLNCLFETPSSFAEALLDYLPWPGGSAFMAPSLTCMCTPAWPFPASLISSRLHLQRQLTCNSSPGGSAATMGVRCGEATIGLCWDLDFGENLSRRYRAPAMPKYFGDPVPRPDEACPVQSTCLRLLL